MRFSRRTLIRAAVLSLLAPAAALPLNTWSSGPFTIRLSDGGLNILKDGCIAVEGLTFAFNFIRPDSVFLSEPSADTLVLGLRFGEGDGFHADFPSHVNVTIRRNGDGLHFLAGHRSFEHVSVRMKDRDEHYYGLIEKLYPDNAHNPDLRGRVVDVDVYGEGSRDYAENYASAYSAFYMSTAGYGSFFDTFARGRYSFAIQGITSIEHQADALDWHLFFGPDGARIHEQYFRVIGRPKAVPLWACGPVFWRDLNRGGSDEILDDARRFTDLRVPLTACWVDRPYSNGANEWSRMDFSEKFADPEKWIRILGGEYGLRFMTWVGPMTFQDRDFPGLLPGYRGYMDLTDPACLAEFERRLAANQYAAGVKGHKMDRADENFPFTEPWHDPVRESESRNKYAYLYSKTIHEFLSRAHGADQFNFARAAFHRCQPYLSAVWCGDSRSNWKGLQGSLANAARSGFMGFPVWGSDTGGYLGPGRIDETLYSRWLNWSAWCGLFEIKIDGSGGEGEDRPPWKYPVSLQNAFRAACEQRMDLLPTVYSRANTSYKNGVLMQPLAYRWPTDGKTHEIWDEYVFCGAFLVAPVVTPVPMREVYLPEGRWFEFRDPATEHAGPASITVNAPVDAIPVFVHENSLYVTGDIFRGNSRKWKAGLNGNGTLVIHAFPGGRGDSTAFAYVDAFDGDQEKRLALSRSEKTVVFESEPLSSAASVEIRCDAKPVSASLDGVPVRIRYDERRRIAAFALPLKASARLELRIR
ncbi:MAG: glycoside hydrolase family 31 protein [bacterium]|nr:glycoside hydrolase family 31 protein [bacterium]